MLVDPSPPRELEEALRRIAELEAALTSTTDRLSSTSATLATVTAERDKLRRAYEQLKAQLELLRRRIFLAKAERIDARQLEIEFAETQAKLVKLATELGETGEPSTDALSSDDSDGRGRTSRAKPKGRRNLGDLDIPEERVEILDPALEGIVERIGFEESYHAGYRRGGPVRIVKARAVYKKAPIDDEAPEIVTASNPKEIYERGMLAPSLIAHILTKKFRWGMPFHRLALELESQGLDLDDSTMCRYAEHVGATLGAIVGACAKEAMQTAFCLSTDATGVAIQPARIPDGKRQACTKGHFFVVLADKDHVFFEYQPKHTSDAVCAMFKGFKGYIQADAHCVYDALFRGEAVDDDEKPPDEVACWSHARRRLWEAAVTVKDPAAREGLLRVRALFKLEESWADLAPKQRYERLHVENAGPCSGYTRRLVVPPDPPEEAVLHWTWCTPPPRSKRGEGPETDARSPITSSAMSAPRPLGGVRFWSAQRAPCERRLNVASPSESTRKDLAHGRTNPYLHSRSGGPNHFERLDRPCLTRVAPRRTRPKFFCALRR